MIDHIAISNFAIIENTEIDLRGGLNIITGETGAGKSIVIEAVSLALGSRADSSCIRTGCDKAVVELTGQLDGEDIGVPNVVLSLTSANGPQSYTLQADQNGAFSLVMGLWMLAAGVFLAIPR